MPLVEIFDKSEENKPLFSAELDFLPRSGEYISREMGGYFSYYNVVEVWHHQESEGGPFRACIAVELDD